MPLHPIFDVSNKCSLVLTLSICNLTPVFVAEPLMYTCPTAKPENLDVI